MCKHVLNNSVSKQFLKHTFIANPDQFCTKYSWILKFTNDIWPASCEKGPSDICKKCRPRPAAASPTPRLVRVCTFWHSSHQWHIHFLLCKQLEYVQLFSTSCRGWSWYILFVMSEGPFWRDAGHMWLDGI